MSAPVAARVALRSGFRQRATLAVAAASMLLTAPFVVNNLAHGRLALGVAGLMVVATLTINGVLVVADRPRSVFVTHSVLPALIAFVGVSVVEQGVIGVLWAYPATVAFNYLLPSRSALIGNAVLVAIAVPAAFEHLDADIAVRVAATLLSVWVLTALAIRTIDRQQDALERWVTTDPLTGVRNRVTLESSLRHSAESERPASLLALDIDHFKQINDRYGHGVGDDVLRALGAVLGTRTRSTDLVFRVGGEEFLVLLPQTALSDALAVAESLRAAVQGDVHAAGTPVTVSIGVAEHLHGQGIAEWMEHADRSLYQAKADGRNAVIAGS